METITEILIKEGMSGRVLSTAVISNLIEGSANRRWGLVHRALESGDLIQLKRGLYVLDPALTGRDLSIFTIANRMVPESYVSMETALDYHGWLQEEPASVRSCIPAGRSRSYQNHFGEFIYHSLPARKSDFFLGVRRAGSDNSIFLIAGPERALGDTLFPRHLEWQGLTGLCSSLRVDLGVLEGLDLGLLRELVEFYRSPELRKFLRNLVKALGGER